MNLMLGAAHSVFFYINIVLITILVLMIGTQLYWFVRSKISGNVIDGEEFAKGIHRGQVVDLRDENKFKKTICLERATCLLCNSRCIKML